MFKRDQVVMSKVTKRRFLVIDVEWTGSWMVMIKPLWKCKNKESFLIRESALILIGNNYRSKK